MARFLSFVGLLFFTGTVVQAAIASDGFAASNGDSSGVTLPFIVEKINSMEPGKGTVRIIQDRTISNRIGRPRKQVEAISDDYIEMSGWRIQVFAGNNQRISKEEAFKKETEIKLSFPELATYVQYSAPFWRLRVGDCRTYKEANDVLIKLKRAFPTYGREMSIIKEKILVKK